MDYEKKDNTETSVSADSGSDYDQKKDLSTVAIASVNEDERRRVLEHMMNTSGNHDVADILEGSASEFIVDKLANMTTDEALAVLTEASAYHDDDYNFPAETLDTINLLLKGFEATGWDKETYDLELRIEATLIKYHSPYPEVRAVCDPTDDPTMPCETIRAYFLGVIWVAIGAFVNEVFDERQPTLVLEATVLQLLLYPCGKLLQYTVPDWGFNFRGVRHTLNPGPWTYKEQMFSTVMVTVGSSSSNFMGYVLTMRLDRFFGRSWVNFGFSFLMNFSTQFFGFGLAGILRRWCVYPVKSVWPTVLPTLALNRALLMPEKKSTINGWTVSRYRFFLYVFAASFVYFWIPSVLFSALSTFNWMTWIAPRHKILAIITGSYLGLGINPVTTFDWAVVNYAKPLVVPFFSSVNRYIGTVIGGFIVLGMYWTNYKWTAYLPINTSAIYDHYGRRYNLSRIINDDATLNHDKYAEYSAPYISMGNLLTNGAGFAVYTFVFVYIVITEWKVLKESCSDFYAGLKNRNMSTYARFNDPMTRMMRVYPEVPDWWFIIILVLSFVFGVLACTVYPTTTPVWGMLVIIVMSAILMVPGALIFAVTGFQLMMSNLAVIITGYMIPENGIANMMCRVYGFNTDERAENFIADQKMGHYAKLPPRALFRGQLLATLIQTFATSGAVEFLIANVPELCSLTQKNRFVCTFPNQLYSASLMYGVIGPDRTFNQIYPVLKYSFLIGALGVFPFIALRKWGPKKLKFLHPVLLLNGISRWGTTYNLSYYTPGLYFAYVFMYHIRRYYLAWWTKYNYILTSALTAGVAFSGILIFCSITITQTEISWWGNTVSESGVDAARAATLLALEPGESFGLQVGEFH
ncbi:OPT oligopeptide transporter protein-domain-containing protein [Lipomyces arxii]|uniref:OPT oligopeptide transporter protein-domain-containing protein n=1 Tax=Lipomyces arxii TaxID=56418 RepID=UPI0034CD2D3C